MTQQSDLAVDFGATFRRQLKFNSPWDLTGCTMTLIVLSNRRPPITFNLPVDAEDGMVELFLTPNQTMQLKRFNRHQYYIDCKYPSGDVLRIIKGRIKENV